MNITIIILGGTSIVNTGDHNTLQVGANRDWNALKNNLVQHGIAEKDVMALQQIVQEEPPQERRLGVRTIDWITHVARQSLLGVGKILPTVSTAVLSGWIKGYFGI